MKLVASDIDGTILDHDGVISERTRNAFEAARQAGVDVVFVTGRPPRWLTPLREQIGHRGTVICSNGAVVWDLGQEKLIRAEALNREEVLHLQEIILGVHPEAGFAAECVTGLRIEPSFVRASKQRRTDLPEPEVLTASLGEEDRIVKFLVTSPTLGSEDFHALVSTALGPLAHVTHSDPRFTLLEISAPGVTKARTLATYSRSLGIEARDVVAFGDMPNDVQMLSWAGEGYAMSGGHPEAIAAARFQAPSLADDGVAQVIEAKLASLTSRVV